MATGLDEFLGNLPALSSRDALGAMAAVARHVNAVAGIGPPSAFKDVTAPTPDGLGEMLSVLGNDVCSPDLLGLVWEQLLAGASRRSQGAHFTPREGAQRVVRLALDAQERWSSNDENDSVHIVWDPAAGGGSFLLAAAREIELRSDTPRAEIVSGLYASDIDEVAVRVCDAALELWCAGAARPTTACGDALIDLPADWPTEFWLIVGNPPFLGQLTSDTARSAEVAARVRAEYGEIASGYVDQAALFLELSLRSLAPGGGLGLILPQSFLGTRDGTLVRSSARVRTHFSDLWIDDSGLFDAAVEVIAIALVARTPAAGSSDGMTFVSMGDDDPIAVPTPSAESWAPLLAAAQGVPTVAPLHGCSTVGDVALVTAGFRQHFYGISDAVRENMPADASPSPQLITSGIIDPLANMWGQRTVKFAGRKWAAPVLDVERIVDAEVKAWFGERMVPKLLLASQTPVLEVLVDSEGTCVPSVPVISVEPVDPQFIWHLAAAITAPSTCARLLSEAAGTGLSASAVRVRAKAVMAIQLPDASRHWDLGAEAARAADIAWRAGDVARYRDSLSDLAVAMVDAYGGDSELVSWWLGRLR